MCVCISKSVNSTTSAASSSKKGFYITQLPRMMPWGWRHAYLNDPDGHEISLYWAGENRMKKTVMKAAQRPPEHEPSVSEAERYFPIRAAGSTGRCNTLLIC